MEDICTVINFRGFRFVIATAPNSFNIERYIKELQKHNIKVLIRFCEPTYKTDLFKYAGITHLDLFIPDGNAPSPETLRAFFDVLRQEYMNSKDPCVAIHCQTSLGRSPLMVAIALVELGVPYEDAVALVRAKKRGAINAKQLEYLSKYKRRNSIHEDRRASCSIQ